MNKPELKTFQIENNEGDRIEIMNYGAIITKWWVMLKDGTKQNITLGYNEITQYLSDNSSMGAIVGRIANRIKDGRFALDGIPYQLDCNNGPNHIHGGIAGFNRKYWKEKDTTSWTKNKLALELHSEDGDQNYPGNLNVFATFELLDDHSLSLKLEAQSDKNTIINLTQHSYFNLDGSKNIGGTHLFTFNAGSVLEKDENGIPTGKAIATSISKEFDFSSGKKIDKVLQQTPTKLLQQESKGYDHHFISPNMDSGVRKMAMVSSEANGLELSIHSDAPGFQFYTSNFLSNSSNGTFSDFQAFCIEPQSAPDAINNRFQSEVLLKAGKPYSRTIVYRWRQD